MKKILSCGGIAVFLATVVLMAVLLACVLTVAVPYFNPDVLQEIACPPNTKLATSWEETTYTEPGEKVLMGYCVDEQGNELPTEDLGYGALAYYPKYFGISLGISFAAGLFILIPLVILFQVVRRKFFPPQPPAAIGQ